MNHHRPDPTRRAWISAAAAAAWAAPWRVGLGQEKTAQSPPADSPTAATDQATEDAATALHRNSDELRYDSAALNSTAAEAARGRLRQSLVSWCFAPPLATRTVSSPGSATGLPQRRIDIARALPAA